MYEGAFPEDPTEFVDYYFKWKTRDNEVLVMKEAGMVQVAMHLNPYTLQIYGDVREVPYIVAVATRPECRRQGKMGRVMGRALQDMERRKVPFTFLLPADPAYYQGQGFVFFPRQGIRGQVGEEGSLHGYAWQEAEESSLLEAAEFSNHILERDYHIFVRRDAGYYKRLMAEVQAEHGRVLLLKSQGALEGMLVYGMEQEKNRVEIQELLLSPKVRRQQGMLCRMAFPGLEFQFCEFQMMARIANLREFVSLLRSREGHSYDVVVEDQMVPNNCGAYRIEIGQAGGRVLELPGNPPQKVMGVGELARTLLLDTSVSLREWV